MKLRLSKGQLAAAGIATALVVGGGASIAAASGPDTASAPITASAAQVGTDQTDSAQSDGETADGADGGPGSEQDAADPTFTGTVPAPAATEVPDGQESAGSDSAEQAALQALATVTQSQAEQAALAAVPGSVTETDLDAEGGYVVYSVEITGADGTVTEVAVDAGDGSVLAQQAGEANDPADTADQPEGANDPQD
ncbi:Peptidase propeptide and YPEB domain-containing protein [Klenkia soli]|uniref:Peptidase propeptide and YPEB domain-containing protein n=1 Tax=Klenkia soli TaxID=1052260 RepID=A0A1H0IQ23_9ACTN|nr:PepSY domain-containing protein [Klenkia soli]SDO33547.1 Peptidase propeptide and YPEB domain-containing protein [Klenkia soli]